MVEASYMAKPATLFSSGGRTYEGQDAGDVGTEPEGAKTLGSQCLWLNPCWHMDHNGLDNGLLVNHLYGLKTALALNLCTV